MESLTLDRLKTIFNRYKLAFRTLNEDDLEIGGGNNIKLLRFYYLYLPFAIGCGITSIGFLVDFVLLIFCGIPFLLYAVYGLTQVNNALKDNRNTTIIRDGELRISINEIVTKLNSTHIKSCEVKLEYIDDELYEGQLWLTDTENRKYILLTLLDHNQSILNDNLDFLSQFIQTKMNTSRIG
ncbi:MAG: hypothetical protein ACO1N0_05960 [Fluviicola sp.]